MWEFLFGACRVGRLGMPFSESVHSDKIFHVENGPIFPLLSIRLRASENWIARYSRSEEDDHVDADFVSR